LPYIYTYASIAAETSVPIMRPMLLEFPTDSCVHGTDLQYMFGSELLVAPIYNSQGQRPVYLPSGRWVDYWTREVIEGPRMQHVEATLDTLPLYVRADALVPTVEPQDHLTEDPFEMVTFDCYLIDEGTFELRDTDGVTRVEASFEGARLEIALEGAKQKIWLHLIPLPDAPQVQKVRANGSDLEMVESLGLDLNSGVGWTSDPDGAVRVVVG
jgi:alpha-D-xyloside xylohydrolase